MSWRRDLLWFFANGHRVTQLSSVGVPDAGVRGSGNSGTKGVFCNWDFNPEDLVRYGNISRRLARLTKAEQRVLELAYGDAGMAVTDCCLLPQNRWRAIAALSPTARARGAKRKNKRGQGSPSVAFANDLLSLRSPSIENRATITQMRSESVLMLAGAEKAFADLTGERVAA